MSKVMGIYVKFWHFFTMPAPQIWPCHVTQKANFERILFFCNSALNIRKSYKISGKKLSPSEVISRKPYGRVEVLSGLNMLIFSMSFICLKASSVQTESLFLRGSC